MKSPELVNIIVIGKVPRRTNNLPRTTVGQQSQKCRLSVADQCMFTTERKDEDPRRNLCVCERNTTNEHTFPATEEAWCRQPEPQFLGFILRGNTQNSCACKHAGVVVHDFTLQRCASLDATLTLQQVWTQR